MKRLSILTAITLSAMFSFAGNESYSITSNTSWSTKNYSVNSGKASTFTISTGKTLTIDESGVSCYECTFNGGNIAITASFSCQSCSFSNTTITLSSATLTLVTALNTFSSVTLTASGTGAIVANAPVIISNSTFTFNNSSDLFNNGGTLAITASTLYFNDNAYFLANAGPVSLQNSSQIFIGNGATSSKAYFKMNGPSLTISDNSGISLGNDNNYYFNWSSYTSGTTNSSISTSPNSLNCGSSFANSCQSPLVYGPVSVSASGLGTISVLPVLLTDFNANLSGNDVYVSWTTQMETNSDHFEIERSEDGAKWELIGTVAAKGNSSIASNYSFTDNAPLSGINYYRLKMVNIDNSFNYSDIKIVRTTAVSKINFFPNPAQSFVNVSLVQSENETSIQLLNISGQVLQTQKVSGGTTVSFNVQQYAKGIYVLRVMNSDGTSVSNKIVIAH
jgi:Secretion system C-terminal sorting domain